MKTKILSALLIGAAALSAQAQNYKVVITGTDGTKTEYETSNVKNIVFQGTSNYIDTDYLIEAEYNSKDELGNYYIAFGNSAPDASGQPAEVGDIQLALELTADRSADSHNAILPEGFYLAGSGANKWEFNLQHSGIIIRLAEGDNGVTVSPIVDGSVNVKHEGQKYIIQCDLLLLSGENVSVEFYGHLPFVAGMTENEEFTEDQDIPFEGCQERYWANWFYPFCDDGALQLYTGSFDEKGNQLEGYWLYIPLYWPKAKDPAHPETFLPDGVYTVNPIEKSTNCTDLPFSCEQGRFVDLWGVIYPSGTYITYLDGKGSVTRGLIKSGTLTVSKNATKLEIDFVTTNGVKIQGVYDGQIQVMDFSEPEKYPTIEGTLTGDINLDFLPNAEGVSYPMGSYIKPGVNQFIVMVTEPNMKKGDYISLELCSDQEVLADGVYTINNKIEPFGGIKGFIDYGGNILYSWYGDLDSTNPQTGEQSIIGPIMGGTVTITTTGTDTRKIVFDCVDEDGHKITGTYEGKFYNIPPQQAPAALKAPAAKSLKEAKAPAPRLDDHRKF